MPMTVDEQAAFDANKKAAEDLAASNAAILNKNKELIGEKKAWQTQRQFIADKFGVKLDDEADLDTAAELLEKARQGTGGGEGKGGKGGEGKPDKATERRLAAMQAELAASQAAAAAAQARANDEMMRSAIASSVAAAGGDAETLTPFVKMSVRVVETDGKFAVQVVDADGNERLAGAKSVTVAQYVEQLRADPRFGSMFKASGASGSGSTGAGQRPNTSGEKTSFEKIQSGLRTLLPNR